MTRNHITTDNRDEVLFAFDQACSRPTATQIIEWCERFPQFADDIRAFAAISRELADRAAVPAEMADESMLARLSTVEGAERPCRAGRQAGAADPP